MTKNNEQSAQESQIEQELKERTEMLKELVDAGKFGEALAAINALNETRDRTLYHEVGKLTRSLHTAIREFQLETNTDSQNAEDLSKMEDASDRLNYVIEMTNKAANKTLDLVEETMPIASEIKVEADSLKRDWARLRSREMKPAEFREFYQRMDVFLDRMSTQSDTVYGNLSEILLAQDFQDLTGQVIRKVTSLVQEVESNLVKLVAMAGNVDRLTGTVHEFVEEETDPTLGQGPQINAEQKEDVVSSQDEVDDLLSSLGF